MKVAGYEVHPAAELFPMLDEAALARLAEDIKANGQRVPVILTADGKVLDGRNRLLACERAGVTPRLNTHVGDNPWRCVWSLNAERRQIEDKLRLALIGKAMLAGSDTWEKAQGKAKEQANEARSEKAQARPRDEKGKLQPSPASHEATLERDHRAEASKKAAARLASEVGVSRATVERALELERRRPDQVQAVLRGDVQGSKALEQAKKEDAIAAIRAEPPPLPQGPFRVISIDPPWRYDSREDDASHRGRNQYADMTVEEIAALPVPGMAHEDCILWLWTTNAFMAEAYQLLEAWGFTPKTILTWDKQKLGLGDWLRNTTEHCLLATRGRPAVTLTNQRTLISEARREHSRKPEAFYTLVESLCPGSKVELFARESRDGWTTWGAEAEKFTAEVA